MSRYVTKKARVGGTNVVKAYTFDTHLPGWDERMKHFESKHQNVRTFIHQKPTGYWKNKTRP